MNIYIKTVLFILLFFSGSTTKLTSQIPIGAVFDPILVVENSVTLTAEILTQFLLRDERSFTSVIGNVNDFFAKARTKINTSIQNLRLLRSIINLYADILDHYQQSISLLNTPLDIDDDGIDDLEVLDKWKQIQILLGLLNEAEKVSELLQNLVEEDAFSMDDKGRVILLQESYQDLIRLKTAILLHRQRINRQLFKYQKEKREWIAFQKIYQ